MGQEFTLPCPEPVPLPGHSAAVISRFLTKVPVASDGALQPTANTEPWGLSCGGLKPSLDLSSPYACPRKVLVPLLN